MCSGRRWRDAVRRRGEPQGHGPVEPGVKPVKVYSTIPMITDVSKKAVSGQSVVADLGSLDGKKGQAVLIEARVPSQKAGKFRLGMVEVTYDVPSQGIKGKSIKADLFVNFTPDAAAAAKVNAEVMNLAEKVSAFKLQTRALSEAEAGNIAAATQKLQAAATVLLNMGEDELAKAAEREILSLKKTGVLSPRGHQEAGIRHAQADAGADGSDKVGIWSKPTMSA